MHDDDESMPYELSFLKLQKAHARVKPPQRTNFQRYFLPVYAALDVILGIGGMVQGEQNAWTWLLLAVFALLLWVTERQLFEMRSVAHDLIQQSFKLCQLNYEQDKELTRFKRGF